MDYVGVRKTAMQWPSALDSRDVREISGSKARSSFDLQSMRKNPTRQLAGAIEARGGLRENRRMRRSLLT